MGHWHLLPMLLHAVKEQQKRPGPALGRGLAADHECLNKVDAYGRTCLDVALANVIQESASIDQKLIGTEINDKEWLKSVRALLNQYYERGFLELSKPLPITRSAFNNQCVSFFDYCSCTPSVHSVTAALAVGNIKFFLRQILVAKVFLPSFSFCTIECRFSHSPSPRV